MGRAALQWCEEMDAALINGWYSDKTIEQVANRVGVSRSSALKRAGVLGLGKKPRLRLSERRAHDFPKISREMQVAQMLADGLEPRTDWRKMGFSSRGSANASLQRIRVKIGWQAQ